MSLGHAREVCVGDICKFHYGKALPADARSGSGYPVFGSNGVVGHHDTPLVAGPTVIVGRKGSFGEVKYSPDSCWPIDTAYYVEHDAGLVDLKWLYFRLATIGLTRLNSAAAVPGLNRDDAYRVAFELPVMEIQRRAASILVSYDELIENNARRIEILEEMAQAIYREWFVEFRYPGHEDVPLVDSELGPIPEGWAARSLQDVIELAYGKALKSGDRRGGPVPVFGSGGVVGSHDVPLVNGPGIVVGRKGNVGSVHWSDDSFFPIDTTFYVKTDLPMAYAYYMLCDAEFIDSHAAVPGLSREQAYGLSCLVPNRQVVEKFAVVMGQIFAFRKVLEESNRNLRETRDLLLPRLISGEIDVSGLDIELADSSV